MIPRTALALLTLSALALAACGSDDDSPAADESLPAVGSAPAADDLAGRAFESTEVTGHELVADSTIELAFTTDSLSARAGCNSMNGGYSITDGALEVGAMASTMMACSDDLMAQDTWLSEFLSSAPAIALDGDTLTLTGDGAVDHLRRGPAGGAGGHHLDGDRHRRERSGEFGTCRWTPRRRSRSPTAPSSASEPAATRARRRRDRRHHDHLRPDRPDQDGVRRRGGQPARGPRAHRPRRRGDLRDLRRQPARSQRRPPTASPGNSPPTEPAHGLWPLIDRRSVLATVRSGRVRRRRRAR
jgi:heat shock protein HslJ